MIGGTGSLRGSRDPALLVDPDRLRHVHEIVEIFQPVLGVDQLPVG